MSSAASAQMLRIVVSLIEFIELQAGLPEIKKTLDELRFELPITGFAQGKIADKPIEFLFDVEPEWSNGLLCDSQKLRRTLELVFDNAIKYTHLGKVCVTVKPRQNDQVESLAFIVSDTEVGIEERQLEAIFEAFSQADSSIRRPYSGLGVGLTLARLPTC